MIFNSESAIRNISSMATIITHPIIPLAASAGIGLKRVPIRAVLAGVFLSVAPDLDVISFKLGIPYSHMLGHRGLSHSLLFALSMAVFFTSILRVRENSRNAVFAFLFISAVSHGLLDAVTNGGLGIAFFAPFSNERYFLPWQVLQVSPIGIRSFLTPRGLSVLYSEALWVWMPAVIAVIDIRLLRMWKNQKTE